MNALKLTSRVSINKDLIQSPNLCDRFTSDELASLGTLVHAGYDRDLKSRTRWATRMESAIDLALQVQKEKSFPWPGCSNVVFPLVTLAALQFQARSYTNIIQGSDVVKYRVAGEDPSGDLTKRADRIARHMSWQVLEEDSAWEEQHDRLLINLCIVGTNFVKTYFSQSLGHNVSELVMARDFVLDYYAKSVESCARKTHVIPLYPNEVYERVQSETFDNVLDETWYSGRVTPLESSSAKQNTRQGVEPPERDEDTPFRFLEQHRLLDLDHDGYAEPYVVTIEETSHRVTRIVARFDRDEDIERTVGGKILRIRPTEHFTKYSFIPAADGGIYDTGFGVLLGPLNESVNSGINQLLDAGTMSNSTGGFLGRGAKIRGGVYTMAPWEWKRVDSTGDDLRKSLVPLPVREPSAVLFQLLSLLINYTDRVAGTTDPMVGVNPGQNTPAETSRNMIDQGMQVYSVIFKRVWRSMKEEFKKLHRLNSTYLPDRQRFGQTGNSIMREDYKSNPDMVVPVADPNITSAGMRITQAQLLREAAHQVPGYDIAEIERNYIRAMRVDSIDKFYPGPDKTPPLPNPKLQIEQAKLQAKDNELQWKKQQFIMELQSQRRLIASQIAKLDAEAMSLMNSASAEQAGVRIEAFNAVIDGLKSHNDSIDSRLKLLMGGSENGQSNGGGIPQLANSPGNSGVSGAPAPMAGGAQGAMGSGGPGG